MDNRKKRIVLITLLCLCLVVALALGAYALGYIQYRVEDNEFHTGKIEVAIEAAGAPAGDLISLFDDDLLLEPGMTVRGNFKVSNVSTDPEGIHCRLYFENMTGDLKDVLQAKVTDAEGNVLYEGPAGSMCSAGAGQIPKFIPHEGAAVFTVQLYYPTGAGNETQEKTIRFDMGVHAVQAKNNEKGEF